MFFEIHNVNSRTPYILRKMEDTMTHRTFLALTAATTLAAGAVTALESPDLPVPDILVTDLATFERALVDAGASTDIVGYLGEHHNTIIRAGAVHIVMKDGKIAIAETDQSPGNPHYQAFFSSTIVDIDDMGAADTDAEVLAETMHTLLAIAVEQAAARAGVTVDLDELAGPDDVTIAARTNPPWIGRMTDGIRQMFRDLYDLGPAGMHALNHIKQRQATA